MELEFELPIEPDSEPDWERVPETAGVLLVEFSAPPPYLGRSANLRRRLRRMLSVQPSGSRWTNVRAATQRVFYQPAGSAFESALALYELARSHRPASYRKYLRLRSPAFVKLSLSNAYPRTYVTTRLTKKRAIFVGPFAGRAAAERFESAFLDLFKIRRCIEEIVPDPEHPGCIYGEMDMCLRPCQARAGRDEYLAEVGAAAEFLTSGGRSLVREIEQAREQSSQSLEFEQAARHHHKLEKVSAAIKIRDEPAAELDHLFGIMVQRAHEENAVALWPLYEGFFQPKLTFSVAPGKGRPVSLDARLRETLLGSRFAAGAAKVRSDHLALLLRWHRGSWRRGEMVLFDSMDSIPYRKLVRAVSRVAAAGA